MKIVFCAPYLPSRVRPRPFNFIRILAEHGHTITLLSVTDGDPDNDAVRRYCSRVLLFPNSSLSAFARCLTALPGSKPLQAVYCQVPGMARALDQLIQAERPDIVHIEHLRAAAFGFTVKTMPVVFDAVDALSALWRKRRWTGSIRQRAVATFETPRVERYERQVLDRFDVCLVSSDRDRDELQAVAPGTRVVTIPNVCDIAELAAVDRSPRPARILFVGRMSYEPNIVAVEEFVFKVLPHLRVSRPGLEFRIVGAAPNRRVQRLAGDPQVSVTGFVPDLRAELSSATISLCNVPVAGGTQNKILESMAAGLPVVANRVTAEPLGVRDREHVLIADPPGAVAQAITELLEDPELAERIALKGQEHVRRNFSLETAATALLNEYERCRHRG